MKSTKEWGKFQTGLVIALVIVLALIWAGYRSNNTPEQRGVAPVSQLIQEQ